jgi:hypothetical protein
METAVFVLIVCLTIILSVYNRRQARALEYMARLEEDRAGREMRERRTAKANELSIEAQPWLQKIVNPLLERPLELNNVNRIFPEVMTLEIKSEDGRRLLVSPLDLADLRRHDRNARRSTSRGAAARLTDFASTPVLGGHWWVWHAARTMADAGEFFDLEAKAVGLAFGLDWGTPSRLWFYVV